MSGSFPFNDNTRVYGRPQRPQSGQTPPAIDSAYDAKPPRKYRKKPIANFIFPLDNIFTKSEITVPGTGFWVSGLDQSAFLRIQIDEGATGNPSNLGILVRNGFMILGEPFIKLLVTNPTAQAGKTLEISVVNDSPDDRIDVNL